MTGTVVQFVFRSMPLLPTRLEPDQRHKQEWYSRIVNFMKTPIDAWNHFPIECSHYGEKLDKLRQIQQYLDAIPPNEKNVLILDLSSYDDEDHLRHGDWDAVESGWNCLDDFEHVVILCHQIATIEGSRTLKEQFQRGNTGNNTFMLLDRHGAIYNLELEGPKRRKIETTLKQNPKPLTEANFRAALLRKSRRHLGHFCNKMSHVHIRTHYDISPFINSRNRAYEYVLSRITSALNEHEVGAIVLFGIGRQFLGTMVEFLRLDTGIPVIYYDSAITDIDHLRRTVNGQNVCLLTDVLLTGQSARDVADYISNSDGIPKHVLSIVGLDNSEDIVEFQSGRLDVTYCAVIPRPFYNDPAGEHPCPMCASPNNTPVTVASEVDFQKDLSRQIADYDFWELLLESSSFQIGHVVSPNKQNHYLSHVDTYKLLSRYGTFVAEALSAQIKQRFPESPFDAIACPKEDAAVLLGYQLARCLAIGSEKVVGIDRGDLEKCSPSVVSRTVIDKYSTQIENNVSMTRPRILIVDDGINSYHTLQRMVLLLNALRGVNVRGAAVFVSRLVSADTEEHVARECRDFFYFYRLSMPVFSTGQCPVCNHM